MRNGFTRIQQSLSVHFEALLISRELHIYTAIPSILYDICAGHTIVRGFLSTCSTALTDLPGRNMMVFCETGKPALSCPMRIKWFVAGAKRLCTLSRGAKRISGYSTQRFPLLIAKHPCVAPLVGKECCKISWRWSHRSRHLLFGEMVGMIDCANRARQLAVPAMMLGGMSCGTNSLTYSTLPSGLTCD